MSTELGKAYIQIVPSAKGIKGAITKELSGESTAAGTEAGQNIAGAMIKAISAAGIGAVIVSSIKSVVDSFADYEQLTGGIETLFKDSSDIVQQYAENAYKTAGLSANDYMETVTSFSASLLQSLGGDTEAAAQKSDQAITDMSDNANKMGSTMESIQNAYQGFAKQNYTMLDNLKLGYGGTKTEMERLLADAEKLSGIHYDISSYADIVDAIHVVQTEMGITGTTAKEAAETVQGSIGAMKAAWENLLTGLGRDDADVGKLVDDFADAAETAIDNIMPVVERAMQGFGDLIDKLGPIISEKMPGFIATVTPILADALGQIFGNLIIQMPSMVGGLAEGISMAIDQALDIPHVDYYIDEYGQLMPVLENVGTEAGTAGQRMGAEFAVGLDAASAASEKLAIRQQELEPATQNAATALSEEEEAARLATQELAKIGIEAYNAITAGGDLRSKYEELSAAAEKLDGTLDANVQSLVDQALHSLNLAATNQELASGYPGLVSALSGMKIPLSSLSGWLIDNGLTAEEWAGQVQDAVDNTVNNFEKLDTDLGLSLEEMAANWQSNIEATANWQSNLDDLMAAAAASGNQAAVDFVNYMREMGVGAADQVQAMHDNMEFTFDTFPPMMEESTQLGMQGVYDAIENGNIDVASADAANGALDAMGEVDFSPAGTSAVDELSGGMTRNAGTAQSAATSVVQSALSAANSVDSTYVGYHISSGIASGIRSGASGVISAAVAVVQSAVNAAKAAAQIGSPSKLFHREVGQWITKGIATGMIDKGALKDLTESADKVTEWIAKKFGVDLNGEDNDAIKAVENWAKAWEAGLDDVIKVSEHAIKLMGRNGTSSKEILKAYRDLQNTIHQQAEEARAMGLEETDEYIIELQELWLKYEDERLKIINDELEAQEKAQKEALEAQEKAFKESYNRIVDTVKDFAKQFGTEYDALIAKQDALTDHLAGFGDLFSYIDEDKGILALENLDDQADAILELGESLEELSARGISKGLLAQIAQMSHKDAWNFAQTLLNMSDEAFDTYNKGYQRKIDAAEEVAHRFYQQDLEQLQNDYLAMVPDILNELDDDMKTVGMKWADAITDGFESRQDLMSEALASTMKTAMLRAPFLNTGFINTALNRAIANDVTRTGEYGGNNTVSALVNGLSTALSAELHDTFGAATKLESAVYLDSTKVGYAIQGALREANGSNPEVVTI